MSNFQVIYSEFLSMKDVSIYKNQIVFQDLNLKINKLTITMIVLVAQLKKPNHAAGDRAETPATSLWTPLPSSGAGAS